MHTCGGFFTHAFETFGCFLPAVAVCGMHALKQSHQLPEILSFFTVVLFKDRWIFFCFHSFMNHHGGIASVINNKVGTLSVAKVQCLFGTPPVFSQRFPFPCKNGNPGLCNGCSCMILGRVYVATGPPHLGTESCQSFY